MRRILSAIAIALSVQTAACTATASGLKITSIYVLSGTVQSSSSSGGAVCLTAGVTVGGGAYIAAIPPTGSSGRLDVIVLDRSANNPLLVVSFNAPKSLPDSGSMTYALLPVTNAPSGTFSMSPLVGSGKERSFTFEIVTGAIEGGTGSCDTILAIHIKQGLPKSLDMLFSQ